MNIKIQAENKFVHLLGALILFFVISPFLELVKAPFPVMSFMFMLAIIITLRALELRKRTFLICAGTGVLAFVLQLLVRFCSEKYLKDGLFVLMFFLYASFMILSIILMIRKMFSATKITEDTIIGGISVYLLIGFLWAIFYNLIGYFDLQAFHYAEAARRPNLFYYSFNTLTTCGYGDIYPVSKFAMVLSNLESILGQMYLGIFIARLVGMHVVHKTSG